MNEEFVKFVVRPTNTHFQGTHAYIVMGVLITQEPIEGIDANESVIDGKTFGALTELLNVLPKRKAKIKTGDATNTLLSIVEI